MSFVYADVVFFGQPLLTVISVVENRCERILDIVITLIDCGPLRVLRGDHN